MKKHVKVHNLKRYSARTVDGDHEVVGAVGTTNHLILDGACCLLFGRKRLYALMSMQ